jgi:hypothetical protein
MIIPFSMSLICRKSSNLFVWIFILGRTSCVSTKDFVSGGYVLRHLRYMAFAALGSSCSSSCSCRAFRIRLDGLWLMSSDASRFTEFLSTCRSFFLSSGSWLHFFAEVSVLSRALHPFIVHRHEIASNFKISNNYLYLYPSQIILRWPLFLSTSVTSILFEILKLNEKSIHIYLPLGVHVYLPLGDTVNSPSFCSVILTQIQIFLFR